MSAQRRVALAGAALLGLLGACRATDDTASAPPPPRTSSASRVPNTTPIATPGTVRPSTATSPSSTSGAATPRSITVVMNGDMLLQEGLWQTARTDAERTGRGTMDFRPVLADLRPVVRSADLAVCHLETPLAPRGGPY
jgi:hypothetical protein